MYEPLSFWLYKREVLRKNYIFIKQTLFVGNFVEKRLIF